MSIVKTITQPPWRTLAACCLLIILCFLGYQIWKPGKQISDGRHDLKSNGIWVQHGWLGDDAWFQRYRKDPLLFRTPERIVQLKHLLLRHHITDIYPHVAPCHPTGSIAAVNDKQTRQFLAVMEEFRVMPWIGGVLNEHVFPDSSQWRTQFIRSIQQMFVNYPQLAGIHINIEPLPSGNQAYLSLLNEVKQALPPEKILSIAAYPPPTIFQRSANVHWDRNYYQHVAQIADQLVVMMYDTSIKNQKFYQYLIKCWTQDILSWSGDTEVLLGLPAYEDAGVAYHYPKVENLSNSLMGVHAGLASCITLPPQYKGIAIYSEWEMDQDKWSTLQKLFLKEGEI